jgi:hypothetical protein
VAAGSILLNGRPDDVEVFALAGTSRWRSDAVHPARDSPGANGVVRGAFHGVFRIRRWMRFRPEVLRVAWCSTKRERDEVVFSKVAGEPVSP